MQRIAGLKGLTISKMGLLVIPLNIRTYMSALPLLAIYYVHGAIMHYSVLVIDICAHVFKQTPSQLPNSARTFGYKRLCFIGIEIRFKLQNLRYKLAIKQPAS